MNPTTLRGTSLQPVGVEALQPAAKRRSGAAGESCNWSFADGRLNDFLSTVFLELSPDERLAAACVCKTWSAAARNPVLLRKQRIDAFVLKSCLYFVHKAFEHRGKHVHHLNCCLKPADPRDFGPGPMVLQHIGSLLADFPNVRSLHLDYMHRSNVRLAELLSMTTFGSMPHLRHLEINGGFQLRRGFCGNWSKALEHLTRLTHLSVTMNNPASWEEPVFDRRGLMDDPHKHNGLLSKLQSLQELHTNVVLLFPVNVHLPTHITQLHLESFAWTDEGLGLLMMRGLVDLRLHFESQDEANTQSVMTRLANVQPTDLQQMLSSVTRLDWSAPIILTGRVLLPKVIDFEVCCECGLHDAVSWTTACRSEALKISWPTGSESVLIKYDFTCLTGLTRLAFAASWMDQIEAPRLPLGPYLKSLKYLTITSMVMHGCHWEMLPHFEALQELDICLTNIVEDDGTVFAVLSKLTQLTQLSLPDAWWGVDGNEMAAPFEELEDFLPGTTITWIMTEPYGEEESDEDML